MTEQYTYQVELHFHIIFGLEIKKNKTKQNKTKARELENILTVGIFTRIAVLWDIKPNLQPIRTELCQMTVSCLDQSEGTLDSSLFTYMYHTPLPMKGIIEI